MGESEKKRLKIIGLTGGIGAGKSLVSRVLRGFGYPVYDCDSSAKSLMAEDRGIARDLVEICGEQIFSSEGFLDKAFLASIIFNDQEKRNAVNKVVHSAVRKDFLKVTAQCKSGILFVESAILATSGLYALCDGIWLVIAPDDVRVKRALSRGTSVAEDILARIKVQESEFEMLSSLEIPVDTINNDEGVAVLPQIDHLLSKLDKN